jgi:hypothetical protein
MTPTLCHPINEAIAPHRGADTAHIQQNAGNSDAVLSLQERAVKIVTINLIATYVLYTWTTRLNGCKSIHLPTQTHDNQVFAMSTLAMGALASGLWGIRSTGLPGDADSANAMDSVAAYDQATGTTVVNGSENVRSLAQTVTTTYSAATEALNALNAFSGAIKGGKPLPLVTSGLNLIYTLGGHPAHWQGVNTFVGGTTYFIASYDHGTWTTGVNDRENGAANDAGWRMTA